MQIKTGDRFEDSRGYKLTVKSVRSDRLGIHYDTGTQPNRIVHVPREAAKTWTRLQESPFFEKHQKRAEGMVENMPDPIRKLFES
jgi:hypothetical protein